MPEKITVILLYDTRRKINSDLQNLIDNPKIIKLTQNFEVARLEGFHGALMLWPIGHYVKDPERVCALKRFKQNNTLIHI
jgi:hypothetical protein